MAFRPHEVEILRAAFECVVECGDAIHGLSDDHLRNLRRFGLPDFPTDPHVQFQVVHYFDGVRALLGSVHITHEGQFYVLVEVDGPDPHNPRRDYINVTDEPGPWWNEIRRCLPAIERQARALAAYGKAVRNADALSRGHSREEDLRRARGRFS